MIESERRKGPGRRRLDEKPESVARITRWAVQVMVYGATPQAIGKDEGYAARTVQRGIVAAQRLAVQMMGKDRVDIDKFSQTRRRTRREAIGDRC